MGLQVAGKALHQRANRFVTWLCTRIDLYNLGGGPVEKEPLIKMGLFQVGFEMYGGAPRPTTKLSGKGLVHYAKELGVRPPVLSRQGLLPGF